MTTDPTRDVSSTGPGPAYRGTPRAPAVDASEATRKPARRPQPPKRVFALVGLAVLTLLAAVFGLYSALTPSHPAAAADGVYFGTEDVSGFDEAQLTAALAGIAAGARVTLTYETTSQTATLADLGAAVDVTATVRAALRADPGSFFSRLAREVVPLQFTVDEATLQAWLADHFPAGSATPASATVGFDEAAGAFTVTPGHSGYVFDLAPVHAALAALASAPQTVATGTLALIESRPAVSDAAALSAAEQANAALKVSLTFTAGEAEYTATAADIVRWTTLTPDEADGVITVGYDAGLIEADLRAALNALLEDTGRPRRVVLAADGAEAGEIDAGSAQIIVGDLAPTAATVAQMLSQQVNSELTVPTSQAAIVTLTTQLTMSPPTTGRWADVDLTTQVATLWEGSTLVEGFVISSGKSETPTPTGLYNVYAKVPLQDMQGYNVDGTRYYIEDVPWATWYYGNYGFHTAYWLDESQIGIPQSHGCINMREADAYYVYTWLPIGAPVVVHGTEPTTAE
jgi:lipoprotein-anchoring transpeptidase ErfK/SrfK